MKWDAGSGQWNGMGIPCRAQQTCQVEETARGSSGKLRWAGSCGAREEATQKKTSKYTQTWASTVCQDRHTQGNSTRSGRACELNGSHSSFISVVFPGLYSQSFFPYNLHIQPSQHQSRAIYPNYCNFQNPIINITSLKQPVLVSSLIQRPKGPINCISYI